MIILVFLSVISFVLADIRIKSTSKNYLYSDLTEIPYKKVGLVLGTTKFLQNGQVNLYYQYRIDAAVALYQAEKISYIVVSGDAKDVSKYYGFKTNFREKLARVKVFVDLLTNKKPRFLGEKIEIR